MPDGLARRLTDPQPTTYGHHPAALAPQSPRAPAYLPPAAQPAQPGPPLAPPWSSPFRSGAWLPRAFHLQVPDPVAGFDADWLDWDAPRPVEARAAPPAPPPPLLPTPLSPVPELPAPPALWLPEPPAAEPADAFTYQPTEMETEQLDTDQLSTTQLSTAEEVLDWEPEPPPHPPLPEPLPESSAKLWDAPQRRPGFVPVAPATERGSRWWLLAGIAVVLIPLVGAGLMLGTRLIGPARTSGVSAVFTAPIMVLRASIAGRIQSVAVANGQTVDPATVLLTIHVEPPPDFAARALRDRLAAANDRAAVLDATLGGPAPTGEAGRAKLADTKRLRAAAAAEIAQLQAALADTAARPAADMAVRAGLNGKVWSVEAAAGTDTAAGSPLVRLVDCDHPFLTLVGSIPLQAGQRVQVQMPGFAPLTGTVRPASGIAEPTGSLVVDPGRIAGPNACPVGLSAVVTPSSSSL